MKITKEHLKSWGASDDGYDFFLRRFPAGEAEYQGVLNAIADADLPDYADWLMENAGPDEGAVIALESIANCKHFFATGRIVIANGAAVTGRLRAGTGIEAGEGIKAGMVIKAGDGIEAGWGIEAGTDIKAGCGIEAGEGIEAGTDIKAGDGFGIFAGLRLPLADWTLWAKVIAKAKPDNLVSGSWVEPEVVTDMDAAQSMIKTQRVAI